MPLLIPDKRPQVHHIRRARLPWRPLGADRTECGLQSEGRDVVDLTEAAKLVQTVGKTRARDQLCITCFETAANHEDWQDNPAAVVARECGAYGGRFGRGEDRPINDELRAIAALIAAHREEFDALVADHRATVSLDGARLAKRRRR